MIRYKLYQDNRKNSTTRGQWYARAAVMGVTDLETLAARIQRNCTAKKSDVMAVLTELVEVMQDELQEGRRVKLDGFGSFKIGISTTGAESPKLFTPTKNVKGVHVLFQRKQDEPQHSPSKLDSAFGFYGFSFVQVESGR